MEHPEDTEVTRRSLLPSALTVGTIYAVIYPRVMGNALRPGPLLKKRKWIGPLAGAWLLVALWFWLLLGLIRDWPPTSPASNAPVFDANKIVFAVQAYATESRQAGKALPPEVSLNELIRRGYLSTNYLDHFDGSDVIFNLSTNDIVPILARAKLPEGNELVALGDGSVQVVSSNRLREQLRRSVRLKP